MDEHEHRAACGFDGSAFDAEGLLEAIRALGPQWQALLATAGTELRRRPEPHVWSAIEHADPAEVVADVASQATRLAQLAHDADAIAWNLGITVGHSRLDVRRLLEHAVHDSVHHLADVEHGLARLRGGQPGVR